MVDLRINETRQIGAVENRPYRVGMNAVGLKTAPTGLLFGRRSFQLRRFNPPRYLPGGENVYLFLEFTIVPPG